MKRNSFKLLCFAILGLLVAACANPKKMAKYASEVSVECNPQVLEAVAGKISATYTITFPANYFAKCSSSEDSIVDGLNKIGVNSSKSSRTTIAKANGISNYTGTASQNTKLLSLLKSGKLVNPGTVYYRTCSSSKASIVDALDSIGVDSSKTFRTKIAKKNGISDYTGTASQNTKLLNLLKKGKLLVP
jgi:hypothetical protein